MSSSSELLATNDVDLTTVNMSLWQTYINGLVGDVEGVEANNILTTGNDLVATIGDSAPLALAQVYRFGNTIPNWKANWQDTDSQLLGMYRTWLEAIRPTNATPTPDQLTQLTTLQTKIESAKDNYSTIFRKAYKAWSKDYTVNGATIPGSPTWDQYRSSGSVATELTNAEHALDGPQSEYDTLSEQIYGDGYQSLQEARAVAAAADPDSTESLMGSNPELEARYQMQIAANPGSSTSGGTSSSGGGSTSGSASLSLRSVPLFEVDQDQLTAYKNWLAAAKKSTSRSPVINFSSSNYSYDQSNWQFVVNIPIPLDDFFWAGVSAGASHSSVDITKNSWKATMSFQGGVFYLPIKAPWLRDDLMRLYANFNGWSDQSPFKSPTQLWGSKGIFNIYVTGLLIAYSPYMRVDVDNWQQSDVKTKWSTSVSFGIGPFTLGSLGGASGGSEHFKQSETATGFETFDVSGQPKIVGVVVEAPNSNENPGN